MIPNSKFHQRQAAL
jgi:hypothetical protein